MDPIDALARSRHEFSSRLAQVTGEHWEQPTPCDEWDVHALVNHVLLGTRMSVQLLEGASAAEVMGGFGDDLVDRDTAVATFDDLADRMRSLFGAPGGLDGTVDHPMGEIPRSTFVGFRIGDQTVHAWDLARAIGAHEQMDADLVEWVWHDVQPLREMAANSGMFGTGPSDELPDDTPLQHRLLDFMGRRP